MSERPTTVRADSLFHNKHIWWPRKESGECRFIYDGEEVNKIIVVNGISGFIVNPDYHGYVIAVPGETPIDVQWLDQQATSAAKPASDVKDAEIEAVRQRFITWSDVTGDDVEFLFNQLATTRQRLATAEKTLDWYASAQTHELEQDNGFRATEALAAIRGEETKS